VSEPHGEQVIIVDRSNTPVGVASRARMRAARLTHRATFIYVFSWRGEVLVQRRTATKDLYPGYLDAAAGGVVAQGESYEVCAARELAEELGIEHAPLERRFDFLYEDASNSCWGRVFLCRHEGPFVLQAEEVESVEFHPVGDLTEGRLAPVTPDTLDGLARLLAEGV
jgi:8-oxo-dGTP pyrophosphatase MutT (NUDIX family)